MRAIGLSLTRITMTRRRMVRLLMLALMLLPTVSFSRTASPPEAVVHAAGKGNPWMNLGDGHAVPAVWSGPTALTSALYGRSASPKALASADFDEDGVPDLLAAYSGAAGGTLVLHRGNVDAIYPNAPEAKERRKQGTFTDAPFLPDADVLSLPANPEFLGAGDFDADGHWDTVMVADKTIYFLPGDGKGSFGEPREIPLPGSATAFTTGEVNRQDGLTDIVVGVTGPQGARVLVFEGPEGALRHEPEVFGAPATVTSLALDRLDTHYCFDLAVAGGENLMVVHGRDRKLSYDPGPQGAAKPAIVDEISLPFPIVALATGDFDADHERDVALLSADGKLYHGSAQKLLATFTDGSNPMVVLGAPRLEGTGARSLVRVKVSSIPGDDLLLFDRGTRQMELVMSSGRRVESPGAQTLQPDPTERRATLEMEGEPMAILPMRLNADALSDLVVLMDGQGTPIVSPTGPLNIYTVTSTADPGDGVCDTVCTFREAITAANGSVGVDSITFNIPGAGPHTIQPTSELPYIIEPVVIDATTQAGYSGIPLIMLDGSLPPTNLDGIRVSGGSSTIRGLAVGGFGVGGPSSLSGITVSTSGGNVIEGNFLGTDTTGSAVRTNQIGVSVYSSDNTIGGTVAAGRNLVSGNDRNIHIEASDGTRVEGNIVGLDLAGATSLRSPTSFSSSIVIRGGATATVVGGTVAGARNIISASAVDGIDLRDPGTSGNLVQGNFIGTDITGTLVASNAVGGIANLNGASGNTMGGTTPSARNIIGANGVVGISIGRLETDPEPTSCIIQGNYIGTDVNGTAPMGSSFGVDLFRTSLITVGGTTPGARNVISGNSAHGIRIWGSSTSIIVQGNYIGTDVSGTVDLGNHYYGVTFDTPGTTIGGTVTGAGNVISGNGGGIREITGTGSLIAGNLIGTDRTGTAALGNGFGVSVEEGTVDSTYGGATVAARNVISGNTVFGIRLQDSNTARIRISGNRIGTDISGTLPLGNGGHGIEIVEATANTVGGPAVSEGNLIQHNALAGVYVEHAAATANAIRFNSIYDNGGLGIDLNPIGVTANDPNDPDIGPNGLQNYPVLLASTTSGGDIDVVGSLQSEPGKSYTIDIYASDGCDASGHGEGKTYVGSIPVTTSAAGRAAFTRRFVASVPVGQAITATATGPSGSTSEFSACFTSTFRPPGAGAPTGLRFVDLPGTVLEWDPVQGVDAFKVFRGIQSDIPRLLTSEIDSCNRVTTPQTTTGNVLTEMPQPGNLLWYLVVGTNQSGDGSAGFAELPNQGPVERQLDSAGICFSGECLHDRCDTGPALSGLCGSCIADICAAKPECCVGANAAWDTKCVQSVRTVCLNLSCPESQGSCSHPLCKAGIALSPGCDPPTGNLNSCVAAVCNVDSFCCNGQAGSWDAVCVSRVADICGLECN